MNNENTFNGLLSITRSNEAILWQEPFDKNRTHFRLDKQLVYKYHLKNGTSLLCEIQGNKVKQILKINGLDPVDFKNRKNYDKLIASNPNQRFDFSTSQYDSLRIIDLLIPVGKGTRALIVSPPKAGKTILLEQLANGIREINPKTRVIILLIDERPEEVTSFKMQTKAMIYHSSMDKGFNSHIQLSNLLIDHMKLELECGNDVVILIDSLTRMGRAYNNSDTRSRSRTMSGGLGSGALEIPRRLFGLARNVEGGGSCTILATILRDTGSRMDEVIFQEFKGTGNSEIILDREIAEERIFPAINIKESGTRKEELLLAVEDLEKINKLRRELLQLPKGRAVQRLKTLMEQFPNNTELINSL
ncbi:transcription termination factor Rho [Candidatus Cloacimonadota bacterium]